MTLVDQEPGRRQTEAVRRSRYEYVCHARTSCYRADPSSGGPGSIRHFHPTLRWREPDSNHRSLSGRVHLSRHGFAARSGGKSLFGKTLHLRGGPAVRIRLPPAGSPMRTRLGRSRDAQVQSATIISNKMPAPLMPHSTNATMASTKAMIPVDQSSRWGGFLRDASAAGNISSALVFRTSRAARPLRVGAPTVLTPELPPRRPAAPAARGCTS